MNTFLRHTALGVLAATALLGPASAAVTAAPMTDRHNRTDAIFVGMMLPHHMSGIPLGRIAAQKGRNAEIRRLGREIVRAQTREARTLRAMAKLFGKQPSMPPEIEERGRMDMAKLRRASGSRFDRVWLDVIGAHHMAAIQMARIEVQAGQNPHVRQLALSIYEVQRRELAAFNRLTRQLG